MIFIYKYVLNNTCVRTQRLDLRQESAYFLQKRGLFRLVVIDLGF